MSGLVRTAIGSFRIEDAVDPRAEPRHWLRWLLPPLRAVECLPRVQLSADDADRIRNGLAIKPRAEGGGRRAEESPLAVSHRDRAPQEFAAIDPAGQLVGILAIGGPGEPPRSETCRSCRDNSCRRFSMLAIESATGVASYNRT